MTVTLGFDRAPLEWFARRADPSLALERAWPAPSWPEGQRALGQVFGLSRTSHFLRHHRGLLPQLWERQITQALKALLDGEPARRLERCQALLVALAGAGACELAAIERISADASDRIDLAIYGRSIDGAPCCIVIEAKLESELSDHQLAKYRAQLVLRYPEPAQRFLWVVAPTKTTRTQRLLARARNQEWKFMTWRRLLINWQRQLPEDTGSDALSLFSEVWKRTGGR
jgi:hypothetical protein